MLVLVLVMLVMVLCVVKYVLATSYGAECSGKIHVMMGTYHFQHGILDFAKTPPSGAIFPAPPTTILVLLLHKGSDALEQSSIASTPGMSPAMIIMRQIL